MDDNQKAWNQFIKTGSVQDYLQFCAVKKPQEQQINNQREANTVFFSAQ